MGSLVAAVMLSGCASRAAEANARAEEAAVGLADVLSGTPRADWARPSATVRDELDSNRAQYRIIDNSRDGRAEFALWLIDVGADPFTDDTPRVGVACVSVSSAEPPRSQPIACPPRLAKDVDAAAVDWSDRSLAHEAALRRIDQVLADTQFAIKGGSLRTVADAVTALESQNLVITRDETSDDMTLRGTARTSAEAPRISDSAQRVSAASCAAIVVSLDPAAAFYANNDGAPC